MQINSNIQMQNTTKPNFQAIKSVKCKGLYKKHPELSKKLVDTFQLNKTAMDFCKKYDVDIVFNACKAINEDVKSSICMFFNNPAKTKFFGLISGAKDFITIGAFGHDYDFEGSLKQGTDRLIEHITECKENSGATGVLDGQINWKEETIKEFLDEKFAKMNAKKAKSEAKANANNKFIKDSEELENSIDKLINNAK